MMSGLQKDLGWRRGLTESRSSIGGKSRQGWIDEGKQMIVQQIVAMSCGGNDDGSHASLSAEDDSEDESRLWILTSLDAERHIISCPVVQSCSQSSFSRSGLSG